jgi:hypothetical protein
MPPDEYTDGCKVGVAISTVARSTACGVGNLTTCKVADAFVDNGGALLQLTSRVERTNNINFTLSLNKKSYFPRMNCAGGSTGEGCGLEWSMSRQWSKKKASKFRWLF